MANADTVDDLLQRRKKEWITLVADNLIQLLGDESRGLDTLNIAADLVSKLCDIEPSERTVLRREIEMAEGGRGGARSTKIGNIVLRPLKLLVMLSKGTVAVAGAITGHPWLIPFATLILWNDILSGLRVEVSEREASLLWALWINRDERHCVRKSAVQGLVNAERETYQRAPLSVMEVTDALAMLEGLRCIETSETNDDEWWIKESVKVAF